MADPKIAHRKFFDHFRTWSGTPRGEGQNGQNQIFPKYLIYTKKSALNFPTFMEKIRKN